MLSFQLQCESDLYAGLCGLHPCPRSRAGWLSRPGGLARVGISPAEALGPE